MVEGIAFDGSDLFHVVTDSTLRRMDKNIKASKALGIAAPKPFNHCPSLYRQWSKQPHLLERYSKLRISSSSQSSTQGRPRFQQSQQSKPKVVKYPKQGV